MNTTEQTLIVMYVLVHGGQYYTTLDKCHVRLEFIGVHYTFTLDRNYADAIEDRLDYEQFPLTNDKFDSIATAVKMFPQKKSDVIYKMSKLGMSLAEIAKYMGMSRSTVQYYLAKANTPPLVAIALSNDYKKVVDNIKLVGTTLTITPKKNTVYGELSMDISKLPNRIVNKLIKKYS